MTCRCGRPALPDNTLCARCNYYKEVFSPPRPIFESRRDIALRAIALRKTMKQFRMVVE